EFDDMCDQRDIPRPITNKVMFGYRIDKYFEKEGVAVELDGWITHSDQYAYEDNTERDAVLLDHGIVTLRITRKRWEEDPVREADRLERLLERRRRERAV